MTLNTEFVTARNNDDTFTLPTGEEYRVAKPAGMIASYLRAGGAGGSTPNTLSVVYQLEDTTESVAGLGLTNNGSVTFVAGQLSNAANFTGAPSESLSRATSDPVEFGDRDWFLACWARATSLPGLQVMVSKDGVGAGNREFALYLNATGNLRALVGDGGTGVEIILSTFVPTINDWNYYLVINNSASKNLEVFVNNSSEGSITYSLTPGVTSQDFLIGQNPGASTWNGQIDQVIKGNFLPTFAQRTALYSGGSGVADPTTVF
jgi:hypothetical protein